MSLGQIITVVAAVLFGGLFLTLAILDRQYKRRFSPEKEADERKALEERILCPDWAFYERHLQRPAPAALRDLYADHLLVTNGGLDYEKGNGISSFGPLDEDALIDLRKEIGCEIIAFATSDCGDAIYLRPGPSEPDMVYITYHDGCGTKVFAESVGVMLEKLRLANRKA